MMLDRTIWGLMTACWLAVGMAGAATAESLAVTEGGNIIVVRDDGSWSLVVPSDMLMNRALNDRQHALWSHPSVAERLRGRSPEDLAFAEARSLLRTVRAQGLRRLAERMDKLAAESDDARNAAHALAGEDRDDAEQEPDPAGDAGPARDAAATPPLSAVQDEPALQAWIPVRPGGGDAAAYGNNRFLVGGRGTFVIAPDGHVGRGAPVPGHIRAMVHVGGRFVAVGGRSVGANRDRAAVWTSVDGVREWTLHGGGDARMQPLRGLAFGQGKLIAVGRRGGALILPDGMESIPQLDNAVLHDLTYGHNTFVAVGGGTMSRTRIGEFGRETETVRRPQIFVSPDGVGWRAIRAGEGVADLLGVTFGRNVFVAVGQGGVILMSSDGSGWRRIDAGHGGVLRGVTYGRDRFVAVGDNGTVLVSPDGTHWTRQDAGTTDTLHRVIYANNRFLIVGANTMWTSAAFP